LETLRDVSICDLEVCFGVERVIDLIGIEKLLKVGGLGRLDLFARLVLLVRLTKNLVGLAELGSINSLVTDWGFILFELHALLLDLGFRFFGCFGLDLRDWLFDHSINLHLILVFFALDYLRGVILNLSRSLESIFFLVDLDAHILLDQLDILVVESLDVLFLLLGSFKLFLASFDHLGFDFFVWCDETLQL
jgi:hypothetical protein